MERRKQIRVWSDGCYDMVHFGHANQLRQAKTFGDRLVVGVHNDADICRHKGPPIFKEQERYQLIRGIKWVDEVVEGSTYFPTPEDPLDKHNCDFCVHGDDISLSAEGIDTYGALKNAGRYQQCKRTVGVSTTNLVTRMLSVMPDTNGTGEQQNGDRKRPKMEENDAVVSPWTKSTDFVATTRLMANFANTTEPKEGDRVVYVDGAWDLFHAGHLAFLEAARAVGDYLIVGVHADATVAAYNRHRRHPPEPIASLHERVLTVLAYRPVSEVLIDPPYSITKEFLDLFKIDVVCHGNATEIRADPETGRNPFEVAQKLNKFQRIDSGSGLVTEEIIERVRSNRDIYLRRNAAKQAKELALFQNGGEPSVGEDCSTVKGVVA